MRRNKGLLLLVIALIAGGLMALYFGYYGKKVEKQPAFREAEDLKERAKEAEGVVIESPIIQAPREKIEEVLGEEVGKREIIKVEDECQKMERDLKEFFAYLDKKDYIRELRIGEDTFTHFKKIVRVLSLNPPVPAGEGLSYDTIIQNIYHFYRVLGFKDLRLIKLILKNEADTMEINLALFYRWLMSGDKCDQKEGLPPTIDTLYRYAGFLINSIGGRAYLFRRETRLSLLINYYCILIIHEADKKLMNSFGINITPFLEPLAEDIENYQLLYFRKEYTGKLIDIKNYYLKKRKVS